MVSFQCHTCGDVVKKPKLDQHRTRCHSGFDCIDCSTTFNSPAEYKGHTSCISEAEKYQKSLYKGPRTGESAPKNNYPPQPASEPYSGGGSSRGRGGFRGGRGGRGGFGGRGGWGQPSTRGTGANDTPLGTPNRRSPVTQSTPAPVKEAPQPSIATESSPNGSCVKRKSVGTEGTVPINDYLPSNKKAKIAKQIDVQHIEPTSAPLTATHSETESTKEKKEKTEKKETSITDEAQEKKSKKRKKKEATSADSVENGSEQAERTSTAKSKDKGGDKEEAKRKKEKRKENQEVAAGDGDVIQEGSIEAGSKKAKSKDKESKKRRKEKGKEDKESVIDDREEEPLSKEKELAELPKQVNGKDKKRKRDIGDVVKHDGDADVGVDSKEMKKKRKKEALEGTIDADSGEEVKKKKKKSKKVKVAEAGVCGAI